MAITFNDNISNKSPKALDNKVGIFQSGNWRPYNSISEAINTIPIPERYIGLMVDILISGINTKYWFRNGITNNDLVIFINSEIILTASDGVKRIGNNFEADLDFLNQNLNIKRYPDWKDVPWSAMTNDVAGYRDTYFNADWIGLNPMIQIAGVTMYVVGVDYDNDGNGNITFKSGKGLYDGQYFRAGNYQAYTAPPIVPNNSFNYTLNFTFLS